MLVRPILLSFAALTIISWAPTAGLSAQGKWLPGKHYQVVKSPQPTQVAAGHVEVLEVFRYTCPHCADLESHVQQWSKSRPSFIEFRQIPAGWKTERHYAQLYYTWRALNRDDLHLAVFAAIHHADKPLRPGDDPKEALAVLRDFAVAHGVEAAQFEQAYRSDAVAKQVEQAEKTVRAYQVTSVPTLIVNGKYLLQLGGEIHDPQELFALINELAEREKDHASKANARAAQTLPW